MKASFSKPQALIKHLLGTHHMQCRHSAVIYSSPQPLFNTTPLQYSRVFTMFFVVLGVWHVQLQRHFLEGQTALQWREHVLA